MRNTSACIRPGSASITSTHSASSPVPTWCSPISRRAPSRIRLAPAVTVTPLHHPIRVAEQWATLDLLSNGRVDFAAGRGYDRREYEPFHVNFDDNQGIFEEGMELIRALWSARRRWSAFRITVSTTSSRMSASHRSPCKSRSRPMWRLSPSLRSSSPARLGCGLIVAPFAAAMSFGGLEQVADLYNETCAKHGKNPAD